MVGITAETPPTNTLPVLLPSLSSDTLDRLRPSEKEPVNFSGDEREANSAVDFLDFILPCVCVCVCVCV